MFCCLWRNVETSCHKHFVVHLPRTTNDAAYQRWVSPTCHTNTFCWSHRWQHAMKPDIGRESRFCLPNLLSTPSLLGLRWNIAIKFGTEKLEWCGYPMVKKKLKIRLFVSTAYTNVSNTSLVFHTKRYGNIPTGTSNGGVECRWGLKNRSVRPISSFIACCQRRDRQML